MGKINTKTVAPAIGQPCVLYDDTVFDQSPEKVLQRTLIAAEFGKELKTLKPYPIASYAFSVDRAEISFTRPAAKTGSPVLKYTQDLAFTEENGKQYVEVVTTVIDPDPKPGTANEKPKRLRAPNDEKVAPAVEVEGEQGTYEATNVHVLAAILGGSDNDIGMVMEAERAQKAAQFSVARPQTPNEDSVESSNGGFYIERKYYIENKQGCPLTPVK